MKYTKLEKNGYYVATQKDADIWYFKFLRREGATIYKIACFTSDGYYGSDDRPWASDGDKWNYREMTEDEKNWMNACIKADKFVNKPEIKLKQTNMTNIAINKARNWPTADLKDGQEFTTNHGKMRIVKNKSTIYVVHNYSGAAGSTPRSMPAGFNYGYCIGRAPFSKTVDLTCEGRFGAFKQEDAVGTKLVAECKVTGAVSLLKALKEEAENLGWRFLGTGITKDTKSLLFEDGDFCQSNNDSDGDFTLAEEWDTVLDFISEREVEECQYVECVVEGKEGDGICKGRVYKRDFSCEDDGEYCVEPDYEYGRSYYPKECFKPSTKEVFKNQGPNISAVGGYKINIKEVKINGYQPMKMVCIGCTNSQQVYSLGALKALYEVMCDDTATYDEESVTFTKDQVSALMDAVS